MRLALVSDAWPPQVNGVARTLSTVAGHLEARGCHVTVVHPGLFRTVPCPGYPSIRLAVRPGLRTRTLLEEAAADAIHIATEGPLGSAARRFCRRRGLPFTSSYHTQFAQYLRLYFKVPERLGYALLRRFHRPAVRTLVPTRSVEAMLLARGFERLEVWGRGVDLERFRPRLPRPSLGVPSPLFLYVGRVASEKNLPAFLSLDLPGTKVVVGDGPLLGRLRATYPQVRFTGYLSEEALALHYAAADVLVFPSRTDTFGNVILEALAAGTPVAAFPVQGPRDILEPGRTGVLSEDLAAAARAALELRRADCRRYAEARPWSALAEAFRGWLEPFGAAPPTVERSGPSTGAANI